MDEPEHAAPQHYLVRHRCEHSVPNQIFYSCERGCDMHEEVFRVTTVRYLRQPSSAAEARAYVRDALDRLAPCADLEVAVLLVSELVTNAVAHARGDDLSLTIEICDPYVRLEVQDGSIADLLVPAEAPLDATGGRGLLLLDRLASRWGVRDLPEGKAVWFELPLEMPTEPTSVQSGGGGFL
ncbi:MAG TPA: ATP-binding protein [Mycobacteriales bacterium]|nr:ATP-binding protein [Mycobacteriales bacterium]